MDVGGKGIGKYNSLAKYLALNLSQKIKDGNADMIEGVFLNNKYLSEISFEYKDDKIKKEVKSSVNYNNYGLSMFRLK